MYVRLHIGASWGKEDHQPNAHHQYAYNLVSFILSCRGDLSADLYCLLDNVLGIYSFLCLLDYLGMLVYMPIPR